MSLSMNCLFGPHFLSADDNKTIMKTKLSDSCRKLLENLFFYLFVFFSFVFFFFFFFFFGGRGGVVSWDICS